MIGRSVHVLSSNITVAESYPHGHIENNSWIQSIEMEKDMLPMFKKMTFRDARKILNMLCLELDGKEASTNKTVSEVRNPDGMNETWWLENDETAPPFDSPRCKAYLKAYEMIAGPVFYGSGIPLERGLMLPDRGVMKAMLREGCVTLGATKPGLFELTQKGKDLISGIAFTGTSLV